MTTLIGPDVCLRPKEIDHEPASCTGVAASGSQHRGSRVLFGPGPRNHVSVGLRSSLRPARDVTSDAGIASRIGQ